MRGEFFFFFFPMNNMEQQLRDFLTDTDPHIAAK